MKNKKLRADLITALKITIFITLIIGIPTYYKYKEHKKFIRYQECVNINLHSAIQEVADKYCLQKLK